MANNLDNSTHCSSPSKCKQTTGGGSTSTQLPWSEEKYAAEKTEVVRRARFRGGGWELVKAVREVFGELGNGKKYYRLISRFAERYDYLFLENREEGAIKAWIYPTPTAKRCPLLDTSREEGKTPDEDGRGWKDAPTQSTLSGEFYTERKQFPKDRAIQSLRCTNMLTFDAVKEYLAGELQNEINHKRGRVQVLKREAWCWDAVAGPEYVLVPMVDRFSDEIEAKKSYASFCEALDRAGELYSKGVMPTLTTAPRNFDSIEEEVEALIENKKNLMAWLRGRLGYTPTNYYILEFTDSGLPHLHLCLFGVNRHDLPSEEEFREYWSERRGQGKEVYFSDIRTRDGSNEWIMNYGNSLKRYIGKTYYDLLALAEGDCEAPEMVDGYKLAMYWVLERKIGDGSPLLTDSNPDEKAKDDDRSSAYSYEYVGAAAYYDIPAYITNRAEWIHKLGKADISSLNDSDADGPPPGDPGCSSRYLGHPLEDSLR